MVTASSYLRFYERSSQGILLGVCEWCFLPYEVHEPAPGAVLWKLLCTLRTLSIAAFVASPHLLFLTVVRIQAHAAASVLGDRIKIARGLQAAAVPRNRTQSGSYSLHTDIALSVQFLLNCGTNHSLSCHGGSTSRAFEFVNSVGYWPYETCQPYIACSTDSQEGFCPHVDTSCTPLNTCKTCMPGAGCVAVESFPNATVSEYGVYSHDIHAIMSEIYVRGPVKASVDAVPLVNYTGGVLWDAPEYRSNQHHHGVSLVGWGYDVTRKRQYWIARNSWGMRQLLYSHTECSSLSPFGRIHRRLTHVNTFSYRTAGEYWGELGYFRIELGKNLLMIESNIAWATPGTFTVHNVPCSVEGDDCDEGQFTYVDPSRDIAAVQRRLRHHTTVEL